MKINIILLVIVAFLLFCNVCQEGFAGSGKYILKSKIIPPVCPKCPQCPNLVNKCEKEKAECPPCKPCGRCPKPRRRRRQRGDGDIGIGLNLNEYDLPGYDLPGYDYSSESDEDSSDINGISLLPKARGGNLGKQTRFEKNKNYRKQANSPNNEPLPWLNSFSQF